MENKRILVCSIPCWNKKTGSDTFSTLLEGFDSEKISNLYIREGIPDSPVCHNYFFISENAVIKSIVNRKTKTGTHLINTEIENSTDEAVPVANHYKSNSSKRNYLLIFAREILWMLGKWKTPELNNFLDEWQPETVLFPMEGYIHFNRINRYILKRTGAKGVGYFWDDNFTYRQSKAFGHKIYRFFQRRDLKKTAKLCSDFFAITPKTKCEADEFFGIDCKILTKPIDFTNTDFESTQPGTPLKMLYTGKLIIGRFDTIKLIGEALDIVNKDKVKIELDVYTTTILDDTQTKNLSPYVHILGAIPQTEVAKVQSEADILLFAEAIEGENSRIARLSFSTKLTDYFRSGKCIFAVGDSDTAPIEYLKQEDAALIATTKEDAVDILTQIAQDTQIISSYAKKAYDCGKRNHDKKQIQKILFETLNG